MSAATLIDRLDKVKATGPDRWIARCPAHVDNGPSLSIREIDGGVLAHCFAGCPTVDVLQAVGLELHDLLDDKLCSKCSREFHPLHPEHELCPKCFRGDPGEYQRHKPRQSRIPARDILELMEHEITVASIIAADFLAEKTITESGWNRLAQAAARIASARHG